MCKLGSYFKHFSVKFTPSLIYDYFDKELKFEEDWGEYFYHEERILKSFENILLMKKEFLI